MLMSQSQLCKSSYLFIFLTICLCRTLANVSTRLGFAIFATEEENRHDNLEALCTNPEQLVANNPWATGVGTCNAVFVYFISFF